MAPMIVKQYLWLFGNYAPLWRLVFWLHFFHEKFFVVLWHLSCLCTVKLHEQQKFDGISSFPDTNLQTPVWYSPMQTVPLPSNPSAHRQVYDPTVFTHTASAEQLCSFDEHSSKSKNNIKYIKLWGIFCNRKRREINCFIHTYPTFFDANKI